ncbi:MAG: site-specific integrase [Mariniphaga sp.]|nr:site-specific integrase [Mariniphaga sp.]
MKSTFKTLFYLKRNAIRKDGRMPIIARITVDGKISQFSTKLEINPLNWNVDSGKALGRTQEIQQINTLLDEIKASVHKIYHEQKLRDSAVTSEKVKNEFLGMSQNQMDLLKLFQKHNDDVFRLIGKSKTKATYQKYEVTRKHVQSFLKTKYHLSDISLKEINHMFITDFEVYLMTTCKCGANTTAKFMQFFKRIILIAKNNGWITTDPFANYKIRLKRVDRGYLTQEEIGKIMKKSFPIKRLEQVRDIFIFSCFCGIAYIDVKKLRAENIRTSFDGNLWIMGKREKTDVSFNIPLLDIPQKILDKYKGTLPENMILPVPSNQKVNAYLKEIGDVCGIDKDLTFHLARHTFATLTLSKGVSIESVSKMLGHTNIKTTQIYARITDAKIGNDMAEFAGKLKGIEGTFNINLQ